MDLGNIWDKAVEVRAGRHGSRAVNEWRGLDDGQGPAPAARVLFESEPPESAEWDLALVSEPAVAIRSARAFLMADRAQAPPSA